MFLFKEIKIRSFNNTVVLRTVDTWYTILNLHCMKNLENTQNKLSSYVHSANCCSFWALVDLLFAVDLFLAFQIDSLFQDLQDFQGLQKSYFPLPHPCLNHISVELLHASGDLNCGL